MRNNNMLAMILAGGRGTRLYALTKKIAKPAVYFGGKYRIIDFPLSNCANSNINVVGVLTQYESVLLNSYAAAGQRWGLDTRDSGVYVLPPREKDGTKFDVYRGTADAITQNIYFVDSHDPDYILILSGDHIYKMDYAKMLSYHKQRGADATIAVYEGSTDTVITYSVPLIPVKATGTGDIFTSVLSGAIMRGFTVHEAAQLAMNFTTKSIQATVDNVKSMKHGIAFELVLPELTNLSK